MCPFRYLDDKSISLLQQRFCQDLTKREVQIFYEKRLHVKPSFAIEKDPTDCPVLWYHYLEFLNLDRLIQSSKYEMSIPRGRFVSHEYQVPTQRFGAY